MERAAGEMIKIGKNRFSRRTDETSPSPSQLLLLAMGYRRRRRSCVLESNWVDNSMEHDYRAELERGAPWRPDAGHLAIRRAAVVRRGGDALGRGRGVAATRSSSVLVPFHFSR